jgi:DNA polymerase-4
MPMAEALRRCPQAVVVPVRFERYHEASRAFFAILGDASPLVESLSLDEAFVDVTHSRALLGDGPTIARALRARVQGELQLTASIGIAPTKFVAKIASDIDKPDALKVIAPDQVLGFLHPLPVSRLWGVGEATQLKLAEIGLETIGAVARYPEASLRRRLGDALGAHLAALARGEDPRDVVAEHEPVTIGHEETFDADVGDPAALAPIVLDQADRVAARLRHADLRATVVVLKVKYGDFRLLSRRRTLGDPTSDGDVLGRTALALLAEVPIVDRDRTTRVRLTGVAASGLEARAAPRQLTLDEAARARGERRGDALDRIREKFGDAAVSRAVGRGPRGKTPPDSA